MPSIRELVPNNVLERCLILLTITVTIIAMARTTIDTEMIVAIVSGLIDYTLNQSSLLTTLIPRTSRLSSSTSAGHADISSLAF